MSNLNDFVIENGVLKKYTGSDEHVVVPEGVKEIDAFAFEDSYNMTELTLPDGLVNICAAAISLCEHLMSVNIPDTVTNIGRCAFNGCGFSSIVLPGGLKTIGDSAFSSCENLKNVVLPDGLKSISEDMFSDCENLEYIKIPDSVETIESGAFCRCRSLQEIVIPPSVTSIGDYAFADCSELVHADIPETVKEVGKSAFSGCRKLKAKSKSDFTIVSGGLVSYNGKEKRIALPNDVKTIQAEAFAGNNNVREIIMFDNIQEIEECAFFNTGLIELVMPHKVAAMLCDENFREPEEAELSASLTGELLTECGLLLSVTMEDGTKASAYIAYSGYDMCNSMGDPDFELKLYLNDSNPDMSAYDNAVMKGKAYKSKDKLISALARLSYPYQLNKDAEEFYVKLLKNNATKAAEIANDWNKPEWLETIAKIKIS